MKILLILLIAIMLTGCQNLSGTVAGGQKGTVDYSISIFGNPLISIKADRKGPKSKAEEETN